jgi:hypothetical protein
MELLGISGQILMKLDPTLQFVLFCYWLFNSAVRTSDCLKLNNKTGCRSGYIFGMRMFQISARTPAIQTEVVHGFPQSIQVNGRIVLYYI